MQDDELSVVVTHQPVAIPSGDTDDDGDDEVIPIKVSVLPLHFFCTHHAAYVIYIAHYICSLFSLFSFWT